MNKHARSCKNPVGLDRGIYKDGASWENVTQGIDCAHQIPRNFPFGPDMGRFVRPKPIFTTLGIFKCKNPVNLKAPVKTDSADQSTVLLIIK